MAALHSTLALMHCKKKKKKNLSQLVISLICSVLQNRKKCQWEEKISLASIQMDICAAVHAATLFTNMMIAS